MVRVQQWRLEFTNRAGASFPLNSEESRTVVMRMVAGAPFEATAEETIHVASYGGGILISRRPRPLGWST